MTDGNGTPPEAPDPRLAPILRVVVEMKGNAVNVNGNAPPDVCIRILTEGIVALARMEKKEQALVLPAALTPPPLRRLPHP